jgi:hypothetical protein
MMIIMMMLTMNDHNYVDGDFDDGVFDDDDDDV